MLESAWGWLKLRWRWVLAGLGALVAMVLMARRRTVPEIPGRDGERRSIDQDAAQKVEELRQEKDEASREVLEDYAEEIKDGQSEMSKRYEEVKDDPKALQEWLLELGRKQRKP